MKDFMKRNWGMDDLIEHLLKMNIMALLTNFLAKPIYLALGDSYTGIRLFIKEMNLSQ
jgi:hypothetical protein